MYKLLNYRRPVGDLESGGTGCQVVACSKHFVGNHDKRSYRIFFRLFYEISSLWVM